MSWLLRKLDSLGGAVVAGALAGAASQGQAFTNAYLQRLGGRLDEAQAMLARARAGDLLPAAAPAVRADLVADLEGRVATLTARIESLTAVDPLWRPFRLATEFDPAVAAATLEAFVPALPLTVATGVHVAVGLLLGLLVWEGCKSPAIPVRLWRRRRLRRRKAAARQAQAARRRTPVRREPTLAAGEAPPAPADTSRGRR
ncbi:DUF2937 family protein [Caenispirillum salinarum]|uniref:DUF2937 family protein n=1 Tax=Caenispirillum salinarum TaxID=859058 RepID=UPI003850AF74